MQLIWQENYCWEEECFQVEQNSRHFFFIGHLQLKQQDPPSLDAQQVKKIKNKLNFLFSSFTQMQNE